MRREIWVNLEETIFASNFSKWGLQDFACSTSDKIPMCILTFLAIFFHLSISIWNIYFPSASPLFGFVFSLYNYWQFYFIFLIFLFVLINWLSLILASFSEKKMLFAWMLLFLFDFLKPLQPIYLLCSLIWFVTYTFLSFISP